MDVRIVILLLDHAALRLELSHVADHSVLAEQNNWDVVGLANLAESCRSLVVLVKQNDHGGIPDLLGLVLDEVRHGADHGPASHVRVHLTQPSLHHGGDVLADIVD